MNHVYATTTSRDVRYSAIWWPCDYEVNSCFLLDVFSVFVSSRSSVPFRNDGQSAGLRQRRREAEAIQVDLEDQLEGEGHD